MISAQETLVRLLVAVVLGALIGLERERQQRTAGLRTHALVCVGSALIIIVSAFGFSDVQKNPSVSFDPSRIAAQVVSGIGFLGAGTIILRREVVRGLTTAASIWVVAGIGLAAGAGLYLAAVACTALVLILLAGVRAIERSIFSHHGSRTINILMERDNVQVNEIEKLMKERNIDLEKVTVRPPQDDDNEVRVELQVYRVRSEDLLWLQRNLTRTPGVLRVESSPARVRTTRSANR